jgi:hypothetical protein
VPAGAGAGAPFLDQLLETLQWVSVCQSDGTYGEWWYLTYGDCSVPATLESGGATYGGGTKGLAWKASLHTGRALLHVVGALGAARQ